MLTVLMERRSLTRCWYASRCLLLTATLKSLLVQRIFICNKTRGQPPPAPTGQPEKRPLTSKG